MKYSGGMKMKLPDTPRRVLTWIKDNTGEEYWMIDSYESHRWSEARAWGLTVLFWQELPPAPHEINLFRP